MALPLAAERSRKQTRWLLPPPVSYIAAAKNIWVRASAWLLRQGGLDLDHVRYNGAEGRWERKRLSKTANSILATAEDAELEYLVTTDAVRSREWGLTPRDSCPSDGRAAEGTPFATNTLVETTEQELQSSFPPRTALRYEPRRVSQLTSATATCACLACATPPDTETAYLLPPPRAAFPAEKMLGSASGPQTPANAPLLRACDINGYLHPANTRGSKPSIGRCGRHMYVFVNGVWTQPPSRVDRFYQPPRAESRLSLRNRARGLREKQKQDCRTVFSPPFRIWVNYLQNLAQEIVLEIVANLMAEDIAALAKTCGSYRSLLRDEKEERGGISG